MSNCAVPETNQFKIIHPYLSLIQLCGEYLKSYGLFMSFRKCVFRLCDFCDSFCVLFTVSSKQMQPWSFDVKSSR